MFNEKLSLRPIIPIKQSLKTSCAVASVTMALVGLGIEVDEQTLLDKYFPTAKLPVDNRNAGVTNPDIIKSVVQIRKDMELENDLQIDIFEPGLAEYVRSRENRYIVKAEFKALRTYGSRFLKGEGGGMRDFLETLEKLSRKGEIGVYAANARMMGLDKEHRGGFYQDILDTAGTIRAARRKFYEELTEFARRGHIVGPHGGATRHAKVLDGVSRVELPRIFSENPSGTSRDGFLIVDPSCGKSDPVPINHLVRVDSMGVRGDAFDCLFRFSPKTELLDSQQYGPRSFLQNLRRLPPFRLYIEVIL